MIRMEDAGALKRKMFEACMRVAKRVGPALMDGEPVGTLDRIKYALGNRWCTARCATTWVSAACAWPTRRRGHWPDLFTFYRSIGINR